MSDLEWYLDVGGKQSGPHTAKEIVELVRAGKIPATSHVTAARMSGDWVAAQDLVDAYNELYAKSTIPAPMDGAAPFTNSGTRTNIIADPNFAPPPRPTEQLEASKIIYLNRDAASERTPDPTEALFQAIQAVREKSSQKTGSAAAPLPSTPAAGKENWSPAPRSSKRFPPQALLIGTLAIIFGITVYGISVLLGKKSVPKPETAETKPGNLPGSGRHQGMPPPVQNPGNKLLNEGGVRTAAPTNARGSNRVNMPRMGGNRVEGGGGARYRDERDDEREREYSERIKPQMQQNNKDDEEVDQNEDGSNARPNPAPVDPSQVNPGAVIPDPANIPGVNPGLPPNETPPHE